MIIWNKHNKLFSKISTIGVLLAVITLIIIQYHWVISSAENDLSELYRSYTYRIFSSISEEFSLFSDPGEIMDYFQKKDNEEELQEAVVSEFKRLNSNDGIQYIKSISYIRKINSENYYTLYSPKGWEYGKSIPEELFENNRRPALIPDINDKDRIWISIPINGINDSSELIIIFHFDIISFYKNKVEKSLNTNNFELKWYYHQVSDSSIMSGHNYSYSPFRVLKNKFFSKESSWLIEIPLHVIMFNDFFKQREKTFFPSRQENPNNNPQPSVYVDILYNGKPFLQSKEYRLTIQWLLSLLLLTGIAAAYLIIIYQVNKLKQLRQREKEFVASVTHELRTPLTVITSAADNIKSGIISPEKIEQYVELIIDQSVRLSTMIEGILLFSRLEGKVEESPHLKPLKLSDIRKSIIMYTQSIIIDTGKNLQIDFGSLPDTLISDKETIELILTNLITNSCKHAYDKDDEGFIRVKGHIQLPNTIILTVEDDGYGIDKSEKKHIFEPFFRGSKSLKEQIKGSGLGLYLSFRKSELFGASLTIESPYERSDGKIRKGSRFMLTIPYQSIKEE
jgi:signal transduction histidine kinase